MGYDDPDAATATQEPELRYDADGNPYYDYGDGSDAAADGSYDDGSADASSGEDGADGSYDYGNADATGVGGDGTEDSGNGTDLTGIDAETEAPVDPTSVDASAAEDGEAGSSVDGSADPSAEAGGADPTLPDDLKPEGGIADKLREKGEEKLGYDKWQKLLNGEEPIKDLDEAKEFAELAKNLFNFDPLTMATVIGTMFLELASSIATSSRAERLAGYSYGVMYGALGMDRPAAPTATVPGQSARDTDAFNEGFDQGAAKADDTKTRNSMLLYITANGEESTLQQVWAKVIAGDPAEDNLSQWQLSWPTPN